MSNNKQLTIGLFGFGVVGESLYHVLQNNRSFNASVSKVCIKHPDKKRDAPASLFTTDAAEILDDPSINVIIELIDDADAAFEIATKTLSSGRSLISANKKMIAEHLPELLLLQKEHGSSFLYEAACCASIPVVRNLEEYYDNDLLQGLQGIVNGSTNFILTRISEDGLDFSTALKQAQKLGFAESDPSLDISGRDAVNKLTILLTHAYGIVTQPDELLFQGIENLRPQDAVRAREKGYEIKLVAQARKQSDGTVAAFVLPKFVKSDSRLFGVKNEYNGMIIESGLADTQFFYGKGAGGFPTASAVLSDLSSLRYNYRYEYKKLYYQQPAELFDDVLLTVYVSADRVAQIPHEKFKQVASWSCDEDQYSVTGTISISQLKENDWWRQKGISLIACPDVFVRNKALTEITETTETVLL